MLARWVFFHIYGGEEWAGFIGRCRHGTNTDRDIGL